VVLRETKLRAGDWVEIRSRAEILSTLDSNGELDGMPFMPEMFGFCGKRFRVYKRAHKTCDTVFPVRGRRVDQAIHLDTRCDGSAHDGCQAGCLLFWKVAWLRPLGSNFSEAEGVQQRDVSEEEGSPLSGSGCSELGVWNRARTVSPDGEPTYTCQATQLPYATTDLAWWDVRQYIEDYRSGNVGLWQLICGGLYFVCQWLQQAGLGVGRPLRWFYDTFYPLWGGTPFPRRRGMIPKGNRTPEQTLNLQQGELVRIKPYKEILATLDTSNRNRGLYFDAEEVPYCGGTYRVLKRVLKIIDERTGKMRPMKSPCIILDSVICQARFSECRLFCPRSIYSYWKETWLERVEPISNPADVLTEEGDQLATQCAADIQGGER
jgi:hypothetical protein